MRHTDRGEHFEPNELFHQLGRRLEQMDGPKLRRAAAIVAERQGHRDAS